MSPALIITGGTFVFDAECVATVCVAVSLKRPRETVPYRCARYCRRLLMQPVRNRRIERTQSLLPNVHCL